MKNVEGKLNAKSTELDGKDFKIDLIYIAKLHDSKLRSTSRILVILDTYPSKIGIWVMIKLNGAILKLSLQFSWVVGHKNIAFANVICEWPLW